MFRRFFWGLLVLAALGPARAQLIGEVPLQQVVTPHFTVIHPPRLEGYARRVAATAEAVREAVSGIVGNQPPRTYVLVGDETDEFNGLAMVFPYPVIRVYATFPQPGLIGAQWQDVLEVLLVHEYTHIAHLTTHGDDPLTAILGRYPGSNTARVPPAWFIEGYAVYLESILTSGGRVADTTTRTLRAQIAREGKWPTLSDAGIGPLERYPGGNTRYSFGAGFVAFLADEFGEDGLRKVIRAYNAGGFDFSEAWERALGTRLEPLWELWSGLEFARAESEAEALRRTGLPQAQRLSAGSSPAWRPDGLLAWWQGGAVRVGWADRRQATTGFSPAVPLPGRPDRLSWDRGGSLVYSRVVRQGGTRYGEVFRLGPGGQETRLTHGARASDAVAEGECVLYVRRSVERSALRRWCGGQDREVYAAPEGWQLFQPAPGPDGAVALAVWRPGGFLDVALLREGALEFVTSDFFQDWWPAWTPEGQLLFASDRRGSSQLYRVREGQLYQLTAEPGGVFGVSPSPQGVVFSSYGGNGLEVKRLERLPEGLEVGSLQASQPPAPALPRGEAYPVEPYA
ncbi:TolB family protein, partial [Calidithermus terrae]|uniref:TolB family protein n=1 Tax=Calidithermus terrae TaxID=1408545 RepID=UPI001C3FA51B